MLNFSVESLNKREDSEDKLMHEHDTPGVTVSYKGHCVHWAYTCTLSVRI